MATLLYIVRLVHIVSGVGWLGEVITINFVLLPALFHARSDDRLVLLHNVFPYLFRLATVPRAGMVVLIAVVALMTAAAHFA